MTTPCFYLLGDTFAIPEKAYRKNTDQLCRFHKENPKDFTLLLQFMKSPEKLNPVVLKKLETVLKTYELATECIFPDGYTYAILQDCLLKIDSPFPHPSSGSQLAAAQQLQQIIRKVSSPPLSMSPKKPSAVPLRTRTLSHSQSLPTLPPLPSRIEEEPPEASTE